MTLGGLLRGMHAAENSGLSRTGGVMALDDIRMDLETDWRAVLKGYMREVFDDDATVAVRCADRDPALQPILDEVRADYRREHGHG
jgi:hypothetical protein